MASVAKATVKHGALKLDNQSIVCFFLVRRSQLVVELDNRCEVVHLARHEGNYRITYLVLFMVRHSRGSYIVLPLLSLEVATPEIEFGYILNLASMCKSASQADLNRM